MNENLNLYEILKGTPKGTKFWSPAFGDLYLQDISPRKIIFSNINVLNKPHVLLQFTPNGTYYYAFSNAECSVFPSKNQRDWSKYQKLFKEGDVVVSSMGDIHLLRTSDSSYCAFRESWRNKLDKTITTDVHVMRLASEEEKQRLFQAIKDNGYEWNAETKTLEKLIEPKFKVGNIIQDKDSYKVKITAIDIEDRFYTYESLIAKGIGTIEFIDQDDWKLVSNKFDISTLKPFDKVLVRDNQHDYWVATLFSHIGNSEQYSYVTTYINTRYCIPYNIETEHLVGTNLEEPEFYKL